MPNRLYYVYCVQVWNPYRHMWEDLPSHLEYNDIDFALSELRFYERTDKCRKFRLFKIAHSVED